MRSVLDDQRVRIALFVVVAVALLFMFVRTGFGDTDGRANLESSSTRSLAPPVQPTLVPPSENPLPTESPTSRPNVANVTPAQIEKFLRAWREFNWETNLSGYTNRLVAAGAIPGTPAASPVYKGEALTICVAEECSSSLVDVVETGRDEDGTYTATITVRTVNNGVETVTTNYCYLTAPEELPIDSEGIFTGVECTGPEG